MLNRIEELVSRWLEGPLILVPLDDVPPPDDIEPSVPCYGHDITAKLMELSDGPPEVYLKWKVEGICGLSRTFQCLTQEEFELWTP